MEQPLSLTAVEVEADDNGVIGGVSDTQIALWMKETAPSVGRNHVTIVHVDKRAAVFGVQTWMLAISLCDVLQILANALN